MIVASILLGLSVFLLESSPPTLAKAEGFQISSASAQRSSWSGSSSASKASNTASNGKEIRIYLGVQRAFLLEKGTVIKSYQVSTGAPVTPTPQGVFQVHRKQELRISKQAVPYRMPLYMAFTENQAFGLHALPYLGNTANGSDYWHEARNHIGRPVSHGCVRFLPDEATEIYEWTDVGTPVHIRL